MASLSFPRTSSAERRAAAECSVREVRPWRRRCRRGSEEGGNSDPVPLLDHLINHSTSLFQPGQWTPVRQGRQTAVPGPFLPDATETGEWVGRGSGVALQSLHFAPRKESRPCPGPCCKATSPAS